MFEKGKYYLYFTINIEDQVILECNEKPEVSNMPLPDFFQEYLSKDKVLIIDNDYSFKFFQSFVLGNEANGVSYEMKKLADDSIKIPMEDIQESLNVGITAAIFMYEAYTRGE